MFDSVRSFYRVLTPLGALLFLCGTVGALLLTPGSPLPQEDGYARMLITLMLVPSAAYALSFSSLGVFGLPCLLVWHGYSSTLQATSMVSASLAEIIPELWLPNLAAVCCTFTLAVPGFLFSLARFRQVLGKSSRSPLSRRHQLGVFLIALALLSLCAFCCTLPASPPLT